MLHKIYLLQIYLILIISEITLQIPPRKFNLNFYSFTCTPISKTFSEFDCILNKVKENEYLLTLYMILSKKMSNNFLVNVQLKIKSAMKKETTTFADITLKVCDVLSTTYDKAVLNNLIQHIRRNLNDPFKCPLKENFRYELKNLSLTNEVVPSFFPFVNFSLSFDYYDKNIMIGTSKIEGEIERKF